MKRMLADVLDRLPYIGRLRRLARSQGNVPAGHYYSPVPDRAEILEYFNSPRRAETDMPEIDLQLDSHLARLRAYSALYGQVPFGEQKGADCRYYYDQTWFSAPDAIFLYCFLRETRPGRIVEVGSGFSTAVMLDTADRFLPQPPQVTCIDPAPGRLLRLLQPRDLERITLIDQKAQNARIDIFTSLRSGDLLFIDSSHVVKCGSDVQFLLFEMLPRLAPGVFVHFHDVFYPFEYPTEWLARGTYLNEAYFLRAFLAYNRRWRIHFFNGYAAVVGREILAEHMPHCLREAGSSLYLCASA